MGCAPPGSIPSLHLPRRKPWRPSAVLLRMPVFAPEMGRARLALPRPGSSIPGDEEIAAGANGDAGAGDFPVEGGGAGEGDGGGDALDAAGGGDMMLVDTEHAQEQEVRLGVRRHTKAVQKELADTAHAGALEDLGARMVNMLGQLKSAGIQIDFAGPPTAATSSAQAGPSVAPSPDKAKAYSRAENFKGDGSSRKGKPVTEGRKYGAVFGSYDVFACLPSLQTWG
ncbi:hypothetical protein AURDEDRAFT_121912 [Auricularia subglabra TFB-10046 SS5]|nr:hypothetical protein AURDEDRAFT_121912 [Auricularia subglabra TFB-10046 SS5]